jgi:hypothetical protein
MPKGHEKEGVNGYRDTRIYIYIFLISLFFQALGPISCIRPPKAVSGIRPLRHCDQAKEPGYIIGYSRFTLEAKPPAPMG